MQFEEYKKIIKQNFPDFKVKKIEKAGEGWDSLAFDVNDQYIFRFPKRDYVSENLKKEISLLPKLKPLVPISIPDFEFFGTQTNGFKFVGYKKIQGDLLSEEYVLGLDKNSKELLAKDVAGFIQAIGAFPTSQAKDCGVTEEDLHKYHTEMLLEIRDKVFPVVGKNTQKYIENLYKSYLTNMENFNYVPVLLHADLSFDHMVYDAKQNRLAGIIDFGDLRIGDPDVEFKWLYRDDNDFFNLVHKYFTHDITADLKAKLEFFNNYDAIYNILHGLRYNEKDKIDWGTKELQKYVQG